MDLLMPSFGLMFWMAIVFFVVLGLLWKFGFPTITKMVEERKQYIDESLRKAHEANEKLANIQEAREQQALILKEATSARDAIVAKAESQAKEQGEKLISDAKVQIDAEKQNAIREIRSQVAELSVKIAEKIIKKQLSTDANQMELIDRLLDEFSSEANVDKQ